MSIPARAEELVPLTRGKAMGKHPAVAAVSWGAAASTSFALGIDDQMFHKVWDGSWLPSPNCLEAMRSVFHSPSPAALHIPSVVTAGFSDSL